MDVYALSDPRTRQVRYVGMAKNAYRRYAQHLNEPHTNEYKNAWMDEIMKAGTAPLLTILESCVEESAIREREKYWIQHYLRQGVPLTNIHHAPVILADEEDKILEDWIPCSQAAHLLSKKMGFPIEPRAIRQLARRKKQPVRTQSLGYHQLYNRDDILAAVVRQKR